ncbi:PspC domain-containing protein [Demequina sp. SO4-18]|uniref:PspC domain-containing protein n=1 Tax=Demequina sp. SO4-18 TaxID=3401026 RepID=UPI003B5CBE91
MTEQPQPPREAAFFTTIRQWGLTRGEHGVVGGVVEGLGARVGMAAVPARLIVVLAWFLLSGLVMLAYAAAWGLLPDRRGNIIIQNFGRGVTNVGALLGIAVLTLFGFGALNDGPLFGALGLGADPWIWGGGMFNGGGVGEVARVIAVLLAVTIPLLIISGVIVLIVWLVKRSKDQNPPASGWASTPDAPAGSGAPGTADAGAGSAGSFGSGGPAAGDGASAPPPVAPATRVDGGEEGATAAGPAASDGRAQPNERSRASAVDQSVPYAPQPWEPALKPGDPRVAGAAGAPTPPPGAPGHAAPPTPPAPPVPPVPYAPYTPPRPSVPGPGKGGYLAFLGVLLVAAAVVIGVERADSLAVSPVLAWGAVVTVGLGVVLIGVALSGRKLGFLGFLSVLAVLAAVPLAANADQIRADYDQPWGWWDVDVTIGEGVETTAASAEPVEPADPALNLTAPFEDDYAQVYIASGCWALSASDDPDWAGDPESWAGAGQASIRLDEVTADTSLEVGDGATTLTVPAGTSVTVARGDYAHVAWEQRDLACDFWGDEQSGDGDWLAFTNPGDPVLEIVPTGTDAAIFIQEEQS